MKNLGYYNGKYGEFDEMTIPMNDRVCYFGDGVYDATYSRNYKIFALDEHIDRLYRSAAMLEIKIDQTKQELRDIIYDMLSKMDTGENFVYFQVTRGSGVRNHVFPTEGGSNLWINIYHKPVIDNKKRVGLILMEDTRFLHCNIKTLNLLPSVIASQRAKERGCFEAVFHRSGRVTECSHSNVHIIKDGVFRTAPLDNLILPGTRRAHLIKHCKALGIPVCEEPFTVEELYGADEIIVSSASAPGLAADTVEGKPVGGKAPELLNALQDAMTNEFLLATN